MQIHVDPLGGWSGDMFVAALLDAFPAFWPEVQAAVSELGLGDGAKCRLVDHRDSALTGRRFLVAAEQSMSEHARSPKLDHTHHLHGEPYTRTHWDGHASHDHGASGPDHPHSPEHHHGGHDHGSHSSWSAIRDRLRNSNLAPVVKDHVIGIFALLAQAEARVHGVAEDAVTFHEVGAVDSIVDIVAAAQLIALVGASRWTSAPLPLGSGRVKTAHGLLPVPAPATALLLHGLQTIDDNIPGERVTPTGAAIARHLLGKHERANPQARRLVTTGTGFGSKTMPGISNCLRILGFDDTSSDTAEPLDGAFSHRQMGVIEFEVDDQSAEDLTQGLDHIRALPGVHDVIQSVAFGKKGRLATHVQILVSPHRLETAIAACFEETTTIGLRHQLVNGAVLNRSFDQVEVGGHLLHVKTVQRPSGQTTGKTEAADVAAQRGHAARVELRRAGEAAALERMTQKNVSRNIGGKP